MTAAAEKEREEDHEHEEPAPSEAQLLDVLYEVLAQGTAPGSDLTTEMVEAFLHEHARAKKPLSELLAFFEKHKLPTDPSAYGCDLALRELASGLSTNRGPISSTYLLDGPTPKPGPAPAAPPQVASRSAAELRAPLQQDTRRVVSQKLLLSLAGLCIFALAGALLASFRQADVLAQRLNEARLQQLSTDNALSALEQRAERLSQALAESQAERKLLSERFQAFVEGDARKWEVEETALRRLLGARFEAARARALSEVKEQAKP